MSKADILQEALASAKAAKSSLIDSAARAFGRDAGEWPRQVEIAYEKLSETVYWIEDEIGYLKVYDNAEVDRGRPISMREKFTLDPASFLS